MIKAYHISDVHLSFDRDNKVLKDMTARSWSKGTWTFVGYIDEIEKFGKNTITDKDFVFVTGDIGHEMNETMICHTLRWLRWHINGTIVICRGNHDLRWRVNTIRTMVGDLPNFHIIDESEILSIGPYTIGCFSNHSTKTEDFQNCDGRYLEMATNIVKQAQLKKLIPVMISHYPLNLAASQAVGKIGIKAYMSGHVHCTSNGPGSTNGLDWKWYNLSAGLTDDKEIEGCFFSTATVDVMRAKHGQIFKEIKALSVIEKSKEDKKVETAKKKQENVRGRRVVVLCGLPGSGKSTVAKILEKRGYARINQDELGSRVACITKAEEALKQNLPIVIDRCNFDVKQRKHWIELANRFDIQDVTAVYFDVSKEICLTRASKRKNHPTIHNEDIAKKAINNIESMSTQPLAEEGFKTVLVFGPEFGANVIAGAIDV